MKGIDRVTDRQEGEGGEPARRRGIDRDRQEDCRRGINDAMRFLVNEGRRCPSLLASCGCDCFPSFNR
jgi:hypothetical protein